MIAGVWQSAGLIMAVLLAGCAASTRTCGRPRGSTASAWRVYVSIVLPILRPADHLDGPLVAVVKVYDLVVAMTNGRPGTASEVPAKFVMDHLFERANVGLATACRRSCWSP